MCFSEKNGLKSVFFRQRLPLSFSLYLKMDNGSFQKLFPKNFFGFLQPGVQASYVCVKRIASERILARDTNFAFFFDCILHSFILCASRMRSK